MKSLFQVFKMATKNIEININNGNGYDTLYPKTVMANITDWQNNVYSKSQTYSRSEVYSRNETYTKSEIDSLLKSGDWENEGTYILKNDKGEVYTGLSGKPLVQRDLVIILNYVKNLGGFAVTNTSTDSYLYVSVGSVKCNMQRIYAQRDNKYYFWDYATSNIKKRPMHRIITMHAGSWEYSLSNVSGMAFLSLSQDAYEPSNWNGELGENRQDCIDIGISNANSTNRKKIEASITVYAKDIPGWNYK